MADHAKLSASSSAKWLNCPGSIAMESAVVDWGNVAAAEGTAAHELAQYCLEKNVAAVTRFGDEIKVGDRSFTVDEDMVVSIQEYLDYCNNLPGQYKWVERKVCYDNWVEEGFGTADFIKVHSADQSVIYAVDLKYGKGVRVEADHNTQAMMYGLGVIQELDYMFEFKPDDIVVCVIVQPRLQNISEFRITVKELLAWADSTVRPAAEMAVQEDPPCFAGSWCAEKFCRARHNCPTLDKYVEEAVWRDFGIVEEPIDIRTPNTLTNEEIGELMEKIPTIMSWARAVEAYAFDEVSAGREVPGYKLVQGREGNRAWAQAEPEVLRRLRAIGLLKRDVMLTKMKSPTQIEKVAKVKNMDVTAIENLWHRPEGKLTIAKANDKRPAVNSSADVDFGVVETDDQ